MGDMDSARVHARRLQLHDHPAPPAGLEVHADGMFHEVQAGDSTWGIAREYSQQFHMDMTPRLLVDANRSAFADGLQPGELLRVPGVTERHDTFFRAQNPGLSDDGDRLVHRARPGDTLSTLARTYGETNGLALTWQDLYAANRSTMSDPDVVRVGQRLDIPGITVGSPKSSLQTLSDLDGDIVATRTGRVRHEAGGIETIDVMRYKADGSHAEQRTSLDAAIAAARDALQGNTARSNPIAIVQTRDGAFHTMPLRGEEASENLDDSDRTLSLAMRADDRGVVAVAERTGQGTVSVRRYDR